MNKEQILSALTAWCTEYCVRPRDVVVGGGAALVMQGCEWRPTTHDIDITVTPAVLDRVKLRLEESMFTTPRGLVGVYHCAVFPVDAHYPQLKGEEWYLTDWVEIDGFRVLTLGSLLTFKCALGRKKDLEDIHQLSQTLGVLI